MSKKHKKFKRKDKKHSHHPAPSQPKPAVDMTVEEISDAKEETIDPIKEMEVEKPKEEEKEEDPFAEASKEYGYVRKDVKKILILMLIIILILIGVYVLSLKTNYLNIFGDWLYKIFNIQTP